MVTHPLPPRGDVPGGYLTGQPWLRCSLLVAKAGFSFVVILLPLPPKNWDYRRVLLPQVQNPIFLEDFVPSLVSRVFLLTTEAVAVHQPFCDISCVSYNLPCPTPKHFSLPWKFWEQIAEKEKGSFVMSPGPHLSPISGRCLLPGWSEDEDTAQVTVTLY